MYFISVNKIDQFNFGNSSSIGHLLEIGELLVYNWTMKKTISFLDIFKVSQDKLKFNLVS